ncbi:MAG: DUF3006 domain-containing protein [Oscillospiraceae bacterium]|nr:DUF3006 domain-containing protein [Oscillospiraceae bacterium]
MRIYTIDRVIASIAVCENEEGFVEEFPVALLPEGAGEGSVLRRDENGQFTLDREAGRQRRDKLFCMQEDVFS